MTRNRWFHSALVSLIAVSISACGDRESVQAQTRPGTQVRIDPKSLSRPLPIDTATAFALSTAFRAAADRAMSAVVRINVTALVPPSAANGRTDRSGNREPRRTRGSGSGFVIDANGHILTNNHVIASAERVSVVLADGRETEARVIAADRNTDVAVVRVEPERMGEIEPALFADSDSLRVGDWVLALGNPLDLSFTVTAGIVSAKGRDLQILRNNDGTQLEAFIQTDAAINPGNSGGPLVDLYGRVVGINTAIQSQTGYFGGAGFAIPINLARKVASDLIQFGVVHRPRLGVVIQDVSAADAEFYKLPSISGVEIASITPGLPAEKSGLQMGDVVVALDGATVSKVAELQDRIARLQPGSRVKLSVLRYGKSLDVSVELAQFELSKQEVAEPARTASGLALLGFVVEPARREGASNLGVSLDNRVQIAAIDRFGPAFEANIFPGWLIVSLNGEEVETPQDVDRIAGQLKPGQVVSLVVLNPQSADPSPTIFNYRVR
jgi:serine protease Do